MKKIISSVISLLFIATFLFAQKQYAVLDWKADVSVNTWLVQQMHTQYDLRRTAFQKAISSKQNAVEYTNACRQKILRVLGTEPAKTKLNPVITGTIRQDGYNIEKIVYESFPGHHVTTNLYIPFAKNKLPAVLLFCGHEDISKATESYQKTAILFAKNGFVVFVIDPISQSERYQLTDATGKPLAKTGTTEHTLLNEGSNLLGTSTPADELWDNVRALDYLVTRPEVDTARIGCLGNSGGGMQTIYFTAFDKRIKVAAPCSYLASRERTMEITGPADGCAQMPNEGKEQLELDDYLLTAAPKPILILAGRYDFIDYSGTAIAYEEMKKIYAAMGQPQKLQLFTYDDGHGISKPKREAAVTWFRKWLYNDGTAIKEPELQTLSAKDLSCTITGQVNTSYQDEINIAQRNLLWFDSFEKSRQQFLQQPKEKILHKIGELIAMNNADREVDAEETGTVVRNNISFHKFILRAKDEIPLPVLVRYPEFSPTKTIIWLYDEGKNKIADSAALMRSYLQQGYAILVCDLRGTGETEDKAELNDPKYFNREYRNAMLSLHIGKPIVGQRTSEVFMLFEFILNDTKMKNTPIEINASGVNALPVLHALLAKVSLPVEQVNLFHTIHSFREILQCPTEKNWYSYVIPGALKYYDIPDLVKLSGAKINFIP